MDADLVNYFDRPIIQQFINQHRNCYMTSTHKSLDSFNLEDLLDAIIATDPEEKVNQHAIQRKMIDLNDIDIKPLIKKPVFPEENVVRNKNKEKLHPQFDGKVIDLTPRHERERKDWAHSKPTQKHQKGKKQTEREKINVLSHHKNDSNQQPQAYQNFYGQIDRERQMSKQRHKPFRPYVRSSPFSKNFPVTFQQKIVYGGVNISIMFDDYKNHESKIGLNSVLMVPFPNMDFQTYVVNDIQKRTGMDIKGILEDYLNNHNSSNFRTGEIVQTNNLKNLPYGKVFFVKTPDKEGLPNYLLQKLLQFVKSFIERSDFLAFQQIVFGEWMWGLIEPYQASNMILKGIIEGLKTLGAKKGLQSIQVFVSKKVEYQAYAKAFREMSDQYLDAFYRQ